MGSSGARSRSSGRSRRFTTTSPTPTSMWPRRRPTWSLWSASTPGPLGRQHVPVPSLSLARSASRRHGSRSYEPIASFSSRAWSDVAAVEPAALRAQSGCDHGQIRGHANPTGPARCEPARVPDRPQALGGTVGESEVLPRGAGRLLSHSGISAAAHVHPALWTLPTQRLARSRSVEPTPRGAHRHKCRSCGQCSTGSALGHCAGSSRHRRARQSGSTAMPPGRRRLRPSQRGDKAAMSMKRRSTRPIHG